MKPSQNWKMLELLVYHMLATKSLDLMYKKHISMYEQELASEVTWEPAYTDLKLGLHN